MLTKSRFGSHGCIPIAEDLAGRRRRHCLDDVGDLRRDTSRAGICVIDGTGAQISVERGALVVSAGMASHPRAPSALGPSRRIPAARSQQRFEPSGRFHTESRPEGVPGADRVPYGPLFGVLKVSGIIEGAAFRPVDCHGHMGTTRLSAQAVALVLKRHAARTGLDPARWPDTRCGPALRPRLLLLGSPSASSPSRRATGARRCFADTSGRALCSVRTPPARLDCRGKGWRVGAPGTVELFADYWLCRPWCDRLGREARKLSKG